VPLARPPVPHRFSEFWFFCGPSIASITSAKSIIPCTQSRRTEKRKRPQKSNS